MSDTTNVLDTAIAELNIDNTQIDPKYVHLLNQKGYSSVGEIYDLQAEGIALILNVEFSIAEDVWSQLLSFVSEPEKWSDSSLTDVEIDLPTYFIEAVKDFFATKDKPRIHTILVRRFGLNGNKRYTLEDIGTYFELTRERVRQLESNGLKQLKNYLFEQRTLFDLYDIPYIEDLRIEIQSIRSTFESETEPVRTEAELFKVIASRYETQLDDNQQSYLRLLFTLFEWKHVDNLEHVSPRITPFWILDSRYKRENFIQATKRVMNVLHDACIHIAYWDLKINLNRRLKNKYNDVMIRSALKICLDIENVGEDYFQIVFHKLRGAPDFAYRVLSDFREPKSLRLIHRELSRRLAVYGEDIPTIRTVGNAMSASERFVAIGKSEWALSDWDDIAQDNIIDVMIDFYNKHNTAATIEEVYDYVKTKRHVNKSSISWYLGSSPEFVRTGTSLYQLAHWGKTEENGTSTARWTKQRTAEEIVAIFDKFQKDVLPVNFLISEMKKSVGENKEFYLVLRNNPAVKLSVVSEQPRRLEAHVVRNYEISQKPTQQERMQSAIREVLRKQPDNTMRLVELRDLISKRWSIPPQSVYGYVSSMIDVQKNVVTGSRHAIVTLVDKEQDSDSHIQDAWDSDFVYDIAISYAGKERQQAGELANILRNHELSVFFDRNQLPDLIGQNLLDQLWTIYRHKARLCIILHSLAYNESDYSQHERQAAQDRVFNDNIKEPSYIILVKLDDAEPQFFPSSFAYLQWNEIGARKISEFAMGQLRARMNKALLRKPATKKSEPTHMQNTVEQVRILFLTANPESTTRLRLDEEVREIDEYLRATKFRDKFDIKQGAAVRHRDLSGLLQSHQPHIVHFSGHGGFEGIFVENDNKEAHLLAANGLQNLFRVLKDNIQCVILNACWSMNQAQAIAQEIGCVIGMKHDISDAASISFARGFYQAIGNGRNLNEAFELGKVEIDLANLGEEQIPLIEARIGTDPSSICFI